MENGVRVSGNDKMKVFHLRNVSVCFEIGHEYFFIPQFLLESLVELGDDGRDWSRGLD